MAVPIRILVVVMSVCALSYGLPKRSADDTIIIQGTTPGIRVRKSGIIETGNGRAGSPPPVVLYSSSTDDGKLQCITREGLQGQCSSFKECYPILFIEDGTKNVALRNDVLNATTSCFLGTNESPIPPRFGQDATNYEEIICCTDENTPQPFKETEEADEDEKNETTTAASTSDGSPVASSCTRPNIVNPAPASEANALPHAYPWMAVLVNGREKQFCGGSLIDDSHILTAAHCITQYSRPNQIQNNLRVILGGHNLKEKEPNRVIAKVLLIMRHAKYNSRTFENDLAMLRLTEPVKLSKFVQPVCLDPKSPSDEWANATLAGWGKTCETCELSPILRQATVQLITNEECQKKYRSHPLFFAIPDIKPGMICAMTPGMDACQGDSGGPMFISDATTGQSQIGIVSWGAGCASWPGVYTRVSSYNTWIHKNRNRKIPTMTKLE